MSKNNPLKRMIPENRNYKLYKAKKQWITACATFMLAFGATAVMNVSASADTNNDLESETPKVAEVASSVATSTVDTAPSSQSVAPSGLPSINSAISSEQPVSQASNNLASSASIPAKYADHPVSSVATSETSAVRSAAQVSEKNGNNQITSQTLTVTGPQTNSDAKTLKESKAAAENIKPIAVTYEKNNMYVLPDTNLMGDAKYFIKNYSELEKAGATFSWVSYVDPNSDETIDIGKNGFTTDTAKDDYYSAVIKVTYADGTSTNVDTTFSVGGLVELNPNKYYYVSKVGDQPDLNTADANGNSLANMLNYDATVDSNSDDITAKLKEPLDTSTNGIRWAEIEITDHSVLPGGEDGYSNGQPIRVIGNPYTVKIPYVVQGLNLLPTVSTDANGDPVINAQLDNSSASLFDPTVAGNTAWGEYFYQNYAWAYAMGIKIKATDWTAPTAGAKTNHFTLELQGLPNAKKQNVVVNYVTPTSNSVYIYNWNNRNNSSGYASGNGKNISVFQNNTDALRQSIRIKLANGTDILPTSVSITSVKKDDSTSGKYTITYNVILDGISKTGQPWIWTPLTIGSNNGTEKFQDEVNKWLKATNNTANIAMGDPTTATYHVEWNVLTTNYEALAPTLQSERNRNIDVTNGAQIFAGTGKDGKPANGNLAALVMNPTSVQQLKEAGFSRWNPKSVPNQMDTTTIDGLPADEWPAGTNFEWLGSDGSHELIFDKAGESKTGSITIELPGYDANASEAANKPFVWTVSNVTVHSSASVTAKSKTVDYGTKLTAADLVTNKDMFPEGTTFQFVDNSEPNWEQPGSYNAVKITATYPTEYKNEDGTYKETTAPVTVAVAINDTRSITVLQGATIPTVDSILNLPSDWATHTASWTQEVNSAATNKGQITVHYPASGLDQIINVYVTVIPKDTAVNGAEFKTDGSLYDSTKTGSIKNGDNQGSILTTNNGKAVSYESYNKGDTKEGVPSSYNQEEATYTPTYSLSGLKINADGSLVSGPQTVIVRVSVPKGTIGALTDKDGNSYYELTSNIVVAQPVTFEFVDDNNNDSVVGTPQKQEFIKKTNDAGEPISSPVTLKFTIPTNYALANGQSLPTSYTLKGYSATNPVVQIHLVHKTETVDPTNKSTNPTKDLNWFKDSGLVEDSIRTINYAGLSADQLAQIPDDQKTQTVEFTRTAKYDMVTGKIVAGSEGEWTTKSDKFASFTPTKIANMGIKSITDANGNSIGVKNAAGALQVPVATAKPGENTTVTVTYTKGQTVTFEFVDTYNNNEVVGKTYSQMFVPGEDTKLDFIMAMPEGKKGVYSYVLSAGQSVPTSYTLKEFSDDSVVVKVGIHQTMHFTLVFWDDTSDKALYSTEVSTYHAGNGESGYYAIKFPAGTFPAGVNAGYYESVGVTGVPEGATISGSYGTPLTNPSSDWTTPNFKWDKTEAVEKALTGATITINVKHKTVVLDGNSNVPDNTKTADGQPVTRSDFSKTFTRKITEYLPAATGTEQTKDLSQTVTIHRTGVRDIVTGILTWNDFKNGEFSAVPVTPEAGYNVSITEQIGDGTATPITSIDKMAVTSDTVQPINIVIRYGAIATAKLTGTGSSTYNGQALTVDELNKGLKVNVTGPTAASGTYTLKNGDVEFSTDGTNWTTDLPTNVNKYQVRLTEQGEKNIQDQFGNNSIIWTKDGNSTITSDASWTINKLSTSATMNNAEPDNYSQTYNGAAPSSIDADKFTFTTTVNGQTVTLNADNLTSDDFTWVDGSAPVNVGTYKIKLTNAGLAKLNADNPNFTLTNAGEGTFTITQADASAVLSGSGTRAYNGQAVSVDDLNVSGDGNNITLTLHYPKNGDANYSTTVKLSADDFTWNTPDGKAPVNANDQAYTLSLNSDAIQKIIDQAVGTGQNGQSNVKFADDAISGQASYTITKAKSIATLVNASKGNYTKEYDAQSTDQINPDEFNITAILNGKLVDLNTTGITGSDYSWVDKDGNALTSNPKNVGTYYIKLNDAGFTRLQADNPNYNLTNTGLGVYKITPAQGSATLSGNNSKVYDGQAITVDQLNSNGQIKVNLSFPGANDATYTLQSGDYTISGNATDAGDYTIALTAAGKQNIIAKINELAGQGNVTTDASDITGNASFTIDKSKNVVSVGGTQEEVYKGSSFSVVYNADGTNSVTVSIARADGNTTGAVGDMANVKLESGDFTIVNSPAENAGSYQVALTDVGLAKIQNTLGGNYAVSVNNNATGTLQIVPYMASAVFSGDPVWTYNGGTMPEYWTHFKVALDEPNNPTWDLTADDLEFLVNGKWTSAAPVNVGKYKVRLSAQGWKDIKAINSANVKWSATASAGEGSYEVKQANVTATLSGKNSMVYSGNAATTADLYAGDSTIKVVINNDGEYKIANLPASFTLTDGDYTWNTTDGKAPVNAGPYTISLTQTGLAKIQTLINTAVGEGNVALTTTPADGGTANFVIDQAVAPNVQLYGSEKSTYNGKAVEFAPTNTEIKKNYGFHNTENLTMPTLTSDDFEWVDKDGDAIAAPVNVGTYYLQLNDKGKAAIANANKNYSFVDKNGKSTISGMITYTVDPANLLLTVSGTASKVYNGVDAKITQKQIDDGEIQVMWHISDQAPLLNYNFTPDDFEVVDKHGQPALHANAGIDENGKTLIAKDDPYYVWLTAAAMAKVRALTNASNYNITQADDSGEYLIYAQNAELTLTGSQTTTYGTPEALDPKAYQIDFSNWSGSKPKPNIALENGDIYVDTNNDDQEGDALPVNVGEYKVKIAKQLADRLQKLYPDYDFAGTIDAQAAENGKIDYSEVVVPKHDAASYNIIPAVTTVKINGAQHVKYGTSTAVQDGQYTVDVTAPVSGKETPIATKVALTADDLTTVPSGSNVGTYTLHLTNAGLTKVQAAIKGHGDVAKNYNWTNAGQTTANFFVDQMPVKISVSGSGSVTYGTSNWQNAIKSQPNGYTLNVTTESGDDLTYDLQAGDLEYTQTPGNAGDYSVVLSAQGLKNIENALGTNYAYPQTAADTTSTAKFTVEKGDANIAVNGSWEKTYDTEQTMPNDLSGHYGVGYVTIYKADGTSTDVKLQPSDLAFANGANATNVGAYDIILSESGKERIKALDGANGDNYNWTFDSTGTYIVDQATGKAELTGQNSKVFDGQPVTTTEVNANGQIVVNLTLPVYEQGAEPDDAPTLIKTINLGSYTLQDDDYIWNTIDGKAPTNVGDAYKITLNKDKILSHLQARLTELNGVGQNNASNVTLTADDLSGTANFTITPKNITNVVISGDNQNKQYDGQGASLDVSGLKINGDDVVADTPLVDTGITAVDFDWYDASGKKLDAAPVNVGSYTARLKSSALKTLQDANPDYNFDAASAVINYAITQAPATAKMGGSSERDYTGQGTSVVDVLNNVTWDAKKQTGFVDGQTLNTAGLTADDYAWYTKNTDGTYTATGDPVNAGTYDLKLKESGLDKIKIDNPNYSFASDVITGEFTYTINPVSGTATLGGENHKTYDGHAVTAAEVTSPSGTIKVSFTFPGSTAKDTYVLQSGDYTWKIADPTNAGTYTLTLSAAGLAHLQAAINQYAGNGNVTLNADSLKGTATFTIDKKPLAVNLTDKTTTPDGKTYDGQSATIDHNEANFGIFDASGLVDGESLNVANLTDGDYEWVDADGKKIDAPTNAGTYYIALTQSGLAQLQKDNPNYKITEQGRFMYVISPAVAKVTISGSQESTDTNIVSNNYKLNVLTGVTIPEGLTYQFTNGMPTESGTYLIGLTPESLNALEKSNPNYKLNISSTADFTLDATVHVIFQDTNENNKQVGEEITKSGVADSTIDLGLKLPENYELASGEKPLAELNSYTFGKDLTQDLYIKLAHKTEEVNPTDPSSNPTKDENWFKDNGLVSDVTRMINYEGLSDAQLAEIPYSEKSQTVHFTRTAKYDLVTKQLVIGSEGAWTPANGNLTGFTPHKFAGYTADRDVPAATVTGDSKDSSVTITYTADEQSVAIKFVDDDNNGSQVGDSITKTGVTDETITDFSDVKVPSHYELAPNNELPTSYTFTAAKDQEITIHLVEKKVTVDPTKPQTNPTTDPNWFADHDLKHEATRTIKLANGTVLETQPATITRTATYNEVTGELTDFSAWTTASWPAYQVTDKPGFTTKIEQTVAGQTTTINSIDEVAITADTQPVTITISYVANAQSVAFKFVDDNDNETQVGKTVTVKGVTDQTVDTGLHLPAGYQLATGETIPATYKFKPTNSETIIHLVHGTKEVKPTDPVKPGEKTPTGKVIDGAHESDLNETITRTINITYPAGRQPEGAPTDIKQAISFERTAKIDEVTGKVSYDAWTAVSGEKWAAYSAPVIAGYTADKTAPAQIVSATDSDVEVDIAYTANPQSVTIKFVDSEGKRVGTDIVKNGVTDETINNLALTVPVHYELAKGQQLPTSYTFTVAKDQVLTIHLTAKLEKVDSTDPQTNPDPSDPNWFTNHGLSHTATRTIIDGDAKPVEQSVTITRTATYNEATGELTALSDWTNGSWSAYQVANKPGYTAKIVETVDGQTSLVASISEVPVTAETKDITVVITYLANVQTGQIIYQDKNGKEIDHTDISGKTGETIKVTPVISTNWQVVPGQQIPESVVVGPDGIKPVVIVIEPQVETSQQTKNITRTIIERLPSGDKQTVQTVSLTGTEIKNLVTGKTTINWSTGKFAAYTPTKLAGYTADLSQVAMEDVTAETKDQTIVINYMPNKHENKIIYRDDTGKEIGSGVIIGQTGETIKVTPQIPTGWQPVPGQEIPTTVTVTDKGIPSVVIKIEHKTIVVKPGEKAPTGPIPGTPSATYDEMKALRVQPTRTIIINYPDGSHKQVVQTVSFTRMATFDEVTGKATYSAWVSAAGTDWSAYEAPVIDGYTVSQQSVAAEKVTPQTSDQTITISYKENSKPNNPVTPDNPDHPVTPDKPVTPNQPVTPDEPVQPNQPQKPGETTHPVAPEQPTTPSQNAPTSPQQEAGIEKSETAVEHVANGHSISAQLTNHAGQKKQTLPQTGNADEHKSTIIGFAIASLAGIFGLAGKKKRDQK